MGIAGNAQKIVCTVGIRTYWNWMIYIPAKKNVFSLIQFNSILSQLLRTSPFKRNGYILLSTPELSFLLIFQGAR